jgi:hypothetical protein
VQNFVPDFCLAANQRRQVASWVSSLFTGRQALLKCRSYRWLPIGNPMSHSACQIGPSVFYQFPREHFAPTARALCPSSQLTIRLLASNRQSSIVPVCSQMATVRCRWRVFWSARDGGASRALQCMYTSCTVSRCTDFVLP